MRLTRRGVAVLVTAIVLIVLGTVLGMPLARALGGIGAGAVLVAVLPLVRRLRPTIVREVRPDRVQRGTSAVAQLVVRNDSAVRQPAFVAHDPVGDDVREIAVRALPPNGSARYAYELPTERRGRLRVGPLTVVRSDLLGLASAGVEVGEAAEVRVYPRRHPVLLSPAGRSRHHHEGAAPPIPVRGSTDLRALREYVVGDELRHLHWKATARTGRLMVREFIDPAQPWCVVLLDDRRAVLEQAAFEEAVEVAASILWESCEQDRATRFATTSGLLLDTGGGADGARTVLDRLCEIQQVDRSDLAPEVHSLGARPGEGWFAYVGGNGAECALAVGRFGQGVIFDLSDGDGGEPSTVLTIRARAAEEALDRWNAAVVR